jgi:hypothetical protein
MVNERIEICSNLIKVPSCFIEQSRITGRKWCEIKTAVKHISTRTAYIRKEKCGQSRDFLQGAESIGYQFSNSGNSVGMSRTPEVWLNLLNLN